MIIESRVIKASGEKGFAVFDSECRQGKIVMILDRGTGLDIGKVYYDPKQGSLRTESGEAVPSDRPLPPRCNHLGEPVDLRKHQDVPEARRGWRETD